MEGRIEKQTLSQTATRLSKRQAETCQLAVACWPTGMWVTPLGARSPTSLVVS